MELLRCSRLIRYWAPVFIWMAGIFYFSSRPNPLDFLPPSRYTSSIDKIAHVSEYAVLAFLLYRALKKRGSSSFAPPRFSTSALIAFAYAVFDEIHQEFVPNREMQLVDLGYDLVGIIAALGLIWMRERHSDKTKGHV